MTPETFIQIVLGTLTHDALRYALGAGGVYLIINRLLGTRLRHRKIRSETPGWPQIRRELLASTRTVLIFAGTGIMIGVGEAMDLLPIYTDVAEYGLRYLIFSAVITLLAHDTWFYWAHWLMHRVKPLIRIHRLHHTSNNPTPFTSYSFHAVEAVIQAGFLPLFLLVVPMHPLAILFFVFHMMLRNALGHCGYEIFPANRSGRPLFDWMTTVTHHDLHHGDARYNLGLYFTWWDRTMGTEHPDYYSKFSQSATPLNSRSAGRIAGLILVLALIAPAVPARADTLNGIYAAPGLGLVVRFEPCLAFPDQVCGRLLWGWDMSQLRHVAPGDMVLTGLSRSANGWANGKLTDPRNGWVFKGSVKPVNNGSLELKGCAGPICRRQIWHPVRPLMQKLSEIAR